jgi:hypothetical protein
MCVCDVLGVVRRVEELQPDREWEWRIHSVAAE